eukprot:SAG31_NODE_1536_length_7983_cov_4.341071_4_plen_106_part_00
MQCIYQSIDINPRLGCPAAGCKVPLGRDANRKKLEVDRALWDSLTFAFPRLVAQRKIIVEKAKADHEIRMQRKQPKKKAPYRPPVVAAPTPAPPRAFDDNNRMVI